MASQINRHRRWASLGIVALALTNAGTSGAVPRQATHFAFYVAENTLGVNIEFFSDAGLLNKVFRSGGIASGGHTTVPVPTEAQFYRFTLYAAGPATFTGTWLQQLGDKG